MQIRYEKVRGWNSIDLQILYSISGYFLFLDDRNDNLEQARKEMGNTRRALNDKDTTDNKTKGKFTHSPKNLSMTFWRWKTLYAMR